MKLIISQSVDTIPNARFYRSKTSAILTLLLTHNFSDWIRFTISTFRSVQCGIVSGVAETAGTQVVIFLPSLPNSTQSQQGPQLYILKYHYVHNG